MKTQPPPSDLSQLPGPKGLPLLGNLLQIDLKRLHTILEAWSDRYGPIYQFRLPHKAVVAISDPELIQAILRDRPQGYRRAGEIEPIFRELGLHGVFSAEGEEWRRQRRLAMQAFNPEYLQRFFPKLRDIAGRLLGRWQQAAAAGQAVDPDQDWRRYTVDITTNLAFGYDMNLLERDGDEFQRHLERVLPALNRRANALFPYWRYVKLPSDRAVDSSLAAIQATLADCVRQARQRLAAQPELAARPANFLEALLSARHEGTPQFSDQEIHGNVLTIFIAGEDTTAHTLSWLLYLMTEHPEAQARMRQEADAALGGASLPPDFATVEKLPYIEAAAHETLRLKSVAPLLFLEANKAVEAGGIALPKGTSLMLATRHAGLRDENFADALEFRPERWLEAPAPGCAHNRNASAPFGSGPRFCPGRNLALLEIKTAMAMLCKNFEIARAEPGLPVGEVFSFTMMPEPFRVRLAARGARGEGRFA
jgi:cytochrome P450